MSQEVTLWIFGTLIGLLTVVIGAIAAALWAHVGHCKDVASAVARIETSVARLSTDIGTHETGLRGAVHEVANRVSEQGMRISLLERE